MQRIYTDTDSALQATKQELNSFYGTMAMGAIHKRTYIVIHRAKKTIIIFTKSIIAVEQDDDGRATIYCSDNVVFYADEKYTEVIKLLV